MTKALVETNWDGYSFQGQIITGADWEGWSCNSANFNYASLISARISGSRLDGISGKGLSCSYAKITRCSMRFADFRAADFRGSTLESVDMAFSDLSCSYFDSAKLSFVCFQGAKLQGANFFGASFENVDFSNCDISECIGLYVLRNFEQSADDYIVVYNDEGIPRWLNNGSLQSVDSLYASIAEDEKEHYRRAVGRQTEIASRHLATHKAQFFRRTLRNTAKH